MSDDLSNQAFGSTNLLSFSSGNISQPKVSCLVLFRQAIPSAFSLALAREGNNMAARMAMMAMTTRSSISVNPDGRGAVQRSSEMFVTRRVECFLKASILRYLKRNKNKQN